MDKQVKILLYGYGNPGRQDDGLGCALVDSLEKWISEKDLACVDLESNYQLNIEDAEIISKYDYVIFADASTADVKDFLLEEVNESAKIAFTTHEASPGYIVKLCGELFDRYPKVYLLHIKGFKWGFQEGLTKLAEKNLNKSLDFIKEFIVKLLPSEVSMRL